MDNKVIIEDLLKSLEKRNMTGHYFETIKDAKNFILDYVLDNSLIAFGGSTTINQIDLISDLKQTNNKLILRDASLNEEEAIKRARESFYADYYFCSSNAVTKDGILINIDGNSNRVACISFGPSKVFFIVGINKIEEDFTSALARARNIAAVKNAERFDIKTPCKITKNCSDCLSKDTICCQFLVTRYSRHKDRIHVIIIDEELGF